MVKGGDDERQLVFFEIKNMPALLAGSLTETRREERC
jgi:hypothetical protein